MTRVGTHLAVRAGREPVSAVLGGLAFGDDVRVGPTSDRWCGVVLPARADLAEAAAAISDTLGVPVLSVYAENVDAPADGGGLELHLYVYGTEIVAHRAATGAPPGPGVVERLIDATDARGMPDDVAGVLSGRYPDAAARYAGLVAHLGLPSYLVDYLSGSPDGPDADDDR